MIRKTLKLELKSVQTKTTIFIAKKRGEVHNREKGEMARKGSEEGEIGAKMWGGGRK